MSTFKDQFVSAAGVRTRYWSAGHGETPLVFLHGLGGSIEDWAGTLIPLSQNRRVVAIDLLGCGKTEYSAFGHYGPDRMRDHVLATLDALSLDTVDLAGWSLGGRIALDVAHHAPLRVRCLILAGPAGIGPDTIINLDAPLHVSLQQAVTGTTASGWRLLRNAMRNGGFRRAARFAARRVTFVGDGQARAAFLAQLRSFVGSSGYLEGPRQDLLAKLPDIHTPTLAIWGRQDNFAPFPHAQTLVELLPNCTLRAIEECGHTVHIEKPDIFIASVDAFLV